MSVLHIFVVVTVLLILCHTQQTGNSVNVTISLGTVTGLHVTGNIDYYSFRGIPYANVTKRFKAPIRMGSWMSVVVANDDAPPCAQPSVPGYSLKAPVEDCLFLNVYTPKLPQPGSGDQSKLPVMVFIHGGGFINGSSNSLIYGPEFFMAERNVVLVSFNYRLGIFGFLSTASSDAQGNAGMKDQVEALRFVKNEILNFGGDPNSITIFGESAGAASVVHHILSPLSKGLFHRAIAESGSALCDWAHIESSVAHERATVIAKNLGCDTTNATTIVNCLSSMSTSALCHASVTNITSIQESIEGLLTFMPVIETEFDEKAFLSDYPENVITSLTEAVPLVIGTNKDEGMLLLTDDDEGYATVNRELRCYAPRAVIKQATEDQLNEIAQQVRAFYFNNSTVNRTALKGYVNLNTDHLFMYPTVRTIRKLVENKNHVYLYHFAYSGGYKRTYKIVTKLGYKGVDHSEELGYLFYSNGFKNTNLSQTETHDYGTMQKMVKLWIAFATYGVPSSSADRVIKNIVWPEITNASELNYLEIDTSFNNSKDYYKDRIALWDQLTHLQRSSAFKTVPATLLLIFVSILLVCKLL